MICTTWVLRSRTNVGESTAAEAVWSDPLMVAVPARHHLLKFKRIPLDDLLQFPLVLCDPHARRPRPPS